MNGVAVRTGFLMLKESVNLYTMEEYARSPAFPWRNCSAWARSSAPMGTRCR